MEAALTPGQLLGNRYRLESLLGASDFAQSYAVTDVHGERDCALKLLPPELRHTPAWLSFQDVARSIAALDVEYVVRVSDLDIDETLGRPFMVSERVVFPSLRTLLAERVVLTPTLWSSALTAFSRALEAASAAGIAHGDLKPENLFLAPENPGWARVTDFGMLALRAASPPPSGIAALGWSAPEQIECAVAAPSADVFALGLISYYALTGRHYLASMWQAVPDPRAVLAELASEHRAASEHARADGAKLTPALDAWFARALAREPALRFATAAEAALDFAAAIPHTSLISSAPSPARAPGPPSVPGIAAAVAAPLLFQELPALAAPPAAATRARFSEPPRSSSRPPGYTARRASTTEHVPGLPPRPPLAAFAAVGVALLLFFSLSAFALMKLLWPRRERPAVATASVVSAPPPSAVTAASSASASQTSLLDALPATRAHFECAPEACEWIVCDGDIVKKGTLDLALSPGKHSCSGSRYGFRSMTVDFVLRANEVARVHFELLPSKSALAAPARPKAAPRGTRKPATQSATKSAPSKSAAPKSSAGKLGVKTR
jgi:serine/threonine protein kinase